MVGRYPTNKLIGRNPLSQQQPKPPFTSREMSLAGPFGIIHRFQRLSRSEGYVGYVLLTLSPLYSPEGFRARLACLIHTANVRSEPGSNPSIEVFVLVSLSTEPALRRTPRSLRFFKSHPCFQRTTLSRQQPAGLVSEEVSEPARRAVWPASGGEIVWARVGSSMGSVEKPGDMARGSRKSLP